MRQRAEELGDGLAYLGQFGPMDSPLLANPIDLIVMVLVAVGSFLWSVRAGGPGCRLDEPARRRCPQRTRSSTT